MRPLYNDFISTMLCIVFLLISTAAGGSPKEKTKATNKAVQRSTRLTTTTNTTPTTTSLPISQTEQSSGDYNDEDEDEDEAEQEGSAAGGHYRNTVTMTMGGTSSCNQLREQIGARHLTEAYMPKCTYDGEFAPMQCTVAKVQIAQLSSYHECYCVNNNGDEVPGTRRKVPVKESINCSHVDRSKAIIILPSTATTTTTTTTTTTRPTQLLFGQVTVGTQGATRRTVGFSRSDDESKVVGNSKLDDSLAQAEKSVDIQHRSTATTDVGSVEERMGLLEPQPSNSSLWSRVSSNTGLLAGSIVGAVLMLLALALIIFFIIYRLRKRDEGSYRLDEPKSAPSVAYAHANDREFFA